MLRITFARFVLTKHVLNNDANMLSFLRGSFITMYVYMMKFKVKNIYIASRKKWVTCRFDNASSVGGERFFYKILMGYAVGDNVLTYPGSSYRFTFTARGK